MILLIIAMILTYKEQPYINPTGVFACGFFELIVEFSIFVIKIIL